MRKMCKKRVDISHNHRLYQLVSSLLIARLKNRTFFFIASLQQHYEHNRIITFWGEKVHFVLLTATGWSQGASSLNPQIKAAAAGATVSKQSRSSSSDVDFQLSTCCHDGLSVLCYYENVERNTPHFHFEYKLVSWCYMASWKLCFLFDVMSSTIQKKKQAHDLFYLSCSCFLLTLTENKKPLSYVSGNTSYLVITVHFLFQHTELQIYYVTAIILIICAAFWAVTYPSVSRKRAPATSSTAAWPDPFIT